MKDGRYLTLNEIHEEQLKLLHRFDAFCKEHALLYSLGWGTLLGAIRHKGFIPWDDDVDVSMSRPDFERLLSLRHVLPNGLMLVDARTSNFSYPCTKLCTTSVRASEPSYEERFEEYLWIDIFVMDGALNSSADLHRRQMSINKAVRRNVWALTNHSHKPLLKRIVQNSCGAFLRLGDTNKRMLSLIEQAANDPGYEKSSRVTSYTAVEKRGWSLSKDTYENTIEVEFEGSSFPAMSCWDEYLTKMYGNYMEMPPEDKRDGHHIKAWRV